MRKYKLYKYKRSRSWSRSQWKYRLNKYMKV